MAAEAPTTLDIRQTAPLNSWIAISNDETRIVAIGPSFKELKEKLAQVADKDYFISKTPPVWAPFAL